MKCDHCNEVITEKGYDKVVFFRMEDICQSCWALICAITDSEKPEGRPLFTGADINGCAGAGGSW